MLKCKIFYGENIKDLEIRINIWLETNPNIKVRTINQSSYGYVCNVSEENTIITIWYTV